MTDIEEIIYEIADVGYEDDSKEIATEIRQQIGRELLEKTSILTSRDGYWIKKILFTQIIQKRDLVLLACAMVVTEIYIFLIRNTQQSRMLSAHGTPAPLQSMT